jgi:antibiotic biosynthesis monooxygenase (ABM) superfamily enzyme
MEYEGNLSSEPVNAFVTRAVKPGCMDDFDSWVQGIRQVVTDFEGYLGTELIYPQDRDDPEVMVAIRFDDYSHLRVWMNSIEQKEEMDGNGMTGERMTPEQPVSAPALPRRVVQPAGPAAPALYKTQLITILAVYPMLLTFSTLLLHFFPGLPRPISILINVVLVVTAMTYFVMPWLTRLLHSWLYPVPTAAREENRTEPMR